MLKNISIISLLAAPLLFIPIVGQAKGVANTENPFTSLVGAPISGGELAASHGKDIPANSLYATSTHNIASGTTGSISTTDSVTGNNGLTTVIQNTGNNALFQTSTVVNITLNH